MQEKKVSDVYKTLFHYTNDAGLYGILSTQSLWATHYRFLNDTKELTVFIKAFKDRINFSKEFSVGETNKILRDFDGLFSSLIQEVNTAAQLFICCFCPSKEEYEKYNGRLSQWRGYAKDSGYAIEFDTAALEQLLKEENPNNGRVQRYNPYLSLGAVGYYYDFDGQSEIRRDKDTVRGLNDRLTELVKLTFQIPESIVSEPELSTQCINQHIELMVECASRIKHYGFHEENEVRIIAPASTKEHLDFIKNIIRV